MFYNMHVFVKFRPLISTFNVFRNLYSVLSVAEDIKLNRSSFYFDGLHYETAPLRHLFLKHIYDFCFHLT